MVMMLLHGNRTLTKTEVDAKTGCFCVRAYYNAFWWNKNLGISDLQRVELFLYSLIGHASKSMEGS